MKFINSINDSTVLILFIIKNFKKKAQIVCKLHDSIFMIFSLLLWNFSSRLLMFITAIKYLCTSLNKLNLNLKILFESELYGNNNFGFYWFDFFFGVQVVRRKFLLRIYKKLFSRFLLIKS